ncbi:hypothetical protein OG497_37550 [Streptomyces sp. NBC_01242]|uniref:hypothetical protein n=1 Tax=Streptomyces sp. NBC_01242 TaxID=2903795 RepID=UPI00225AD927|nr:hypothetical protein [Streptomyces sp. NBC_01242]MCX4799563.1 hypothetical protein [Streptomyces sp. NBC_01242]
MEAFNVEVGSREIETLIIRGINSAWEEDQRATTVIVSAQVVMPTLASPFKVGVQAVAFDDNAEPAVCLVSVEKEFSRREFIRNGEEIGRSLKGALDRAAGES